MVWWQWGLHGESKHYKILINSSHKVDIISIFKKMCFFSPSIFLKLKALTILDKWQLTRSYLKENEKSLFNPIGYFISLNLHVKITYMKILANIILILKL